MRRNKLQVLAKVAYKYTKKKLFKRIEYGYTPRLMLQERDVYVLLFKTRVVIGNVLDWVATLNTSKTITTAYFRLIDF